MASLASALFIPLKGPLSAHGLRYATAFSAGMAIAGVTAGGIRLLPWLFDSAVPWRVAVPFARGLAELAFEAALLLGWPLGWALAATRLVESGEARVLALVGERPARTASRLLPQGLLFAAMLAMISLAGGRDASAPGRIVTELVAQARVSCERASNARTYDVPFLGATWLCAPGVTPRLVGQAPASFGGIFFTAANARIGGDFRQIDLDDARLAIKTTTIHVGSLTVRGLPPFARASSLPPAWRALLVALSGGISAWLSAYLVVRRFARNLVAVLAVGASGPLAALGTLRLFERSDAHLAAFFLLPVAAAFATVGCALLLWRLPRRRATASK